MSEATPTIDAARAEVRIQRTTSNTPFDRFMDLVTGMVYRWTVYAPSESYGGQMRMTLHSGYARTVDAARRKAERQYAYSKANKDRYKEVAFPLGTLS